MRLRNNFFCGVRLELAQLLLSGDYNLEFLLFYNNTFAQGKGWTFRAWELRQGEIGWKSFFVSDVWAAVRYKPGFQHFVDHQFSSHQFSRSVMSDSLQPHESQHARPPCPSPTPGVHSDSRPSSQWCHPAISSSVVPFSSCPHTFQHQSLFQRLNSSHEVSKVLEFHL